MIRDALRNRRWPAFFMLAIMVTMPITVIAYGLDDGWSPLQRGTIEPEGWRGGPLEDLLEDSMEGDDSLLRMLDHIGATPENAQVPVQSHVLGLAVPPHALPGLYEAEALSSSTPLRTAVIAYNAGLELMDAEELLASPDLRMADDLPIDAQVAIAVLLYAITDASLLQKEAVAGLSDEDYTALMGLPGMILSGRLDPTDGSEEADEDFAQAYGLLSQVDKRRIDEAALIMVHAVSHAMPALRDWAQREREQAHDPDARIDEIGSLLDQYTPARIDEMDSIERLDILADTLRMASGFQEVDVSPYLQPLPAPEGETPLRDAILALADVLEAAGLPLGELVEESELRRADALPRSMQVSVARIVTNQAAVVQASVDLNDAVEAVESSIDPDVLPDAESLTDPDALTDPEALPDIPESQRQALLSALGDLRHAELRTVLAVQQGAPTLEAWGLHWAREPSMLPATPAHAPGKLADASAMASAVADPATSLQEVMSLAGQARGVQMDAAEAPLPPRGSLADSVLDLYDRLGIDANATVRDDIAQGAEALHPTVERNAARILVAQLDALDALAELEDSLSADDRLAMIRGAAALERLQSGEVSLRDVQAIRAHYEVRDRIESTYLDAAADVAAAIDASSHELGEYADDVTGYKEPVEEKSTKSKPWYAKAWSAVSSIQVIGTASAQSTPIEPIHFPPVCPDSALADCENDVWFMDPILETVVVSGFDETRFDPQDMGKDWQRADVPQDERGSEAAAAAGSVGQLLTVDLGGEDIYRNNAGGVSPVTLRGEEPPEGIGQPSFTLRVAAVALDLGGDDRYLTAPDGHGYDAVQGAATAGIGVLYDRRGDDRYEAMQQAQGFGAGQFGIGVLLDGDGDDRYIADDFSQGAAQGSGIGILVDRAGTDHYTLGSASATGHGGATGGLGLLVDAEGDDTYEDGMQGQGTDGGIGVFADLAGDDSHSRTHADEEQTAFGDGECWTSLRAPQGSGYDIEDETFEDSDAVAAGVGVYASAFGDDAQSVATSGHGLFVDLDASDCSYDEAALLPGDVPDPNPESLQDVIDSIVDSEYLVEIPAIVVVGDEQDTHYPGCQPTQDVAGQWAQKATLLELCDYIVSVDIRGDDTYENRAGGVDTGLQGQRDLPGILIDSAGGDTYKNTEEGCVQGCDAILIDLGGDDTFIADVQSQGISRSAAMIGILFNAGGNDEYTIQRMSGLAQGAVQGAEAGIGILLDVSGNDAYRSPSQGAINAPLTGTGFSLVAGFATATGWTSGFFLDLSGQDMYQPAGLQGSVSVIRSTSTPCCGNSPSVSSRGSGIGAFVDTQGHDRYVGTSENTFGPDLSGHQNDQSRIQSHGGVDDRAGVTTTSHAAPGMSLFIDMARTDHGDVASQAASLQQPEDLHGATFRVSALGIAVGTIGRDLVQDDYTLFIDPGGDDTYRNNAGGTVLRVARDTTAGEPQAFREGGLTSTTYDPDRNYPLASLLIDLDGDDLYAADNSLRPDPASLPPTKLKGILTQGAGFLGTGILVDEAGNPAAFAAGADASGAADDTYIARAMSQGFGLYGWGILWDRVGDDTYRYDPAVVRHPVLDGNLLAWLQYNPAVAGLDADGSAPGASDGMWEMHMRGSQWTRDCRIVVPGHEQATFHGLTVSRGTEDRFAFSVFAGGLWRLHQVADFGAASQNGNPCSSGSITLNPAQHMARQVEEPDGSDRPSSNQVNPQFVQIENIDSILWQDDRDGNWSFYHKRLSHAVDDPAIPLGNGMLGGNESRASNQQDPVVHGSHVVYQDDRHAGRECPEGTSSIHRFNLNTRQEEQISQGCGFHVNPQISDSFIVWQTRASMEDPWAIAVYDLAKRDEQDVLRILAAPGDQYEPVVADETILYTDADGGHKTMQYDWDTNTSRVERFDAIQPVLDGQASFRAAWVDITGRDATNHAPARSEYWEVHRKDLSSEALPEADGIRRSTVAGSVSSPWMMGASYTHGRGVLVDEGGHDTYRGDRFVQGSVATLMPPKNSFLLEGPVPNGLTAAQYTPGLDADGMDSYGVLLDADGNDAYSARQMGQGVHFGRETFLFTGTPSRSIAGTPVPGVPVLETETTANVGLLLDLRGNDQHVANTNSQGYGAWATGLGTTMNSCIGSAPHPGCNPYRSWASQSYGLFMDLGGLDTYGYPQSLYQEISVQDDFCGTAESAVRPPLRSLLVGHNDTLRDTVGGFSTVGVYDEDGDPMSPPPPADVAEAEQKLFDRDQFNEDFNNTFEQPLWSFIEEDWPDEEVSGAERELKEFLEDALAPTVRETLEQNWPAFPPDVPAEVWQALEEALSETVWSYVEDQWPDEEDVVRGILEENLDEAVWPMLEQTWPQEPPDDAVEWREEMHPSVWPLVADVWPRSQQVLDLLDQTAFEALETSVDAVLKPLVEVCQTAEGIARAEKNKAEENLTGEPAGESGERNNAVWRQKPRGGIEDGATGRAGSAAPPPFMLGGVGMDIPLLDNLNRALMAGANRLIQTELQVSAMDEDDLLFDPGASLQSTVKLIANVRFTDQSKDLGLEFDRAEFFADRGSGFNVLGTVVDSTAEGDRVLFNRTWHTDSEEFPDGSYDLRTRVHYRHPASGFNLGYAQDETGFAVDNLPRILPDPVLPLLSDSITQAPITEFSPFPYGDDQIAGHPVVTFGVSSDHTAAAQGHGWVRIDIVDELDDIQATLFDGPVDSDGTMRHTWTGTDDSGSSLPSGRYLMRIQATDLDPEGDWPNADRVRDLTAPVVVYSNTPHTGCVGSSLDSGCNAGAILNAETGQVDASGVLNVPLALDAVGDPGDAPSGLQEIRRFHVRLGTGPVDDITWQDPLTLGVGSSTYDLRIQDGQTWHVLALAEDRAGNLECAPACAQRTDASVLRGEESTLLAAFAKKLEILEEGAFATFAADLQRPSIRNAKVFVDGDAPTSLVPRIGAGAVVTVTYQVEEENGEPNPILEWWHEEEPKRIRFHDTTHPAVTILEAECVQALRTCYQATWQGWPGLVDMQGDPWKEGIVKARLGAEDPALNPVRLRDQPSFEFLLDRTAPVIDDVQVVYPDGRFHAEQGDEVRIVIEASDPILSGFLTQPRDLFLAVADASSVTAASGVEGTCTLRFEPGLCFQSQLKAWETVIPIDDTAWSDDPDLQAGRFDVAIDVTDAAGNTHREIVELVLGAPMLLPENAAQDVDVFEASTAWETTRDSKAYLLYGEGRKDKDLVHRINSTDGGDHIGSLHEFVIEDLEPGTPYVVRFIAIDPESNATESGPLTSFSTLHGVEMEMLNPHPDAPDHEKILSGLHTVRGEGWVLSAEADDNLTVEPRVVIRLYGPGLPEAGRVVYDGFTEDGSFELDLVTDALEDGVHSMETTVSYLGEEVTTTVDDLLVDNSAPRLSMVAPVDEALLREAPETIVVRVDENLTAIDEDSVRLVINGQEVHAEVVFKKDGEAHDGVIELTDLPRIRAGILRLEVFAQDMAGNPGHASIKILYDPDAPATLAEVLYPDDQEAARPGQWITIQVTDAVDAAGIDHVTADTTAFGGEESIVFVRGEGRHVLELLVPPSHDEGTYAVPVEVVDGAGNVRHVRAQVVVDTTAPVLAAEFLALDPHRGVAQVNASEPVTVVAEAAAEGVETVRSVADELAALHVLDLAGLQAGIEYEVTVTVRDAAGNEATSTRTWSFRPELGDVPGVGNLSAAARPDEVRLGWDHAGDGFRYAVHRAKDGSFETVAIAAEATYTDEGVEAGSTYRYFVQALDPHDRHGAPSRVVDVQVPAAGADGDGLEASVRPTRGVALQTEFVFTARLEGAAEAEPSVWLVLDDDSRRMSKDPDEDCRESCTFRHATTLAPLDQDKLVMEFYVEVFDASGAVRLPESGPLPGPEVDHHGEQPEEEASNLPILFVLATMASIVLVRRRDSL